MIPQRPRRNLRPLCWLIGHVMTTTLHRPFCLRCGLGIKS